MLRGGELPIITSLLRREEGKGTRGNGRILVFRKVVLELRKEVGDRNLLVRFAILPAIGFKWSDGGCR